MSSGRIHALLSRLYREARSIPDRGTRNRILNLTDRVRTEIRKQERKQERKQQKQKAL